MVRSDKPSNSETNVERGSAARNDNDDAVRSALLAEVLALVRPGVAADNGLRRAAGDNTARDGAAGLPALRITEESERPRNVTIRNEGKGTSDTVAAINPRPGETLAQLVKRLHPGLSDEQLAREVKAVLKYNRAYGNDLGDGMHLDSSKPVYLTSVKFRDSQGRVTRIEGPTGRITEVAYDANGLSSYRIIEADGTVLEQVSKDASGRLVITRGGKVEQLEDLDIDRFGNITITQTDGSKVGHLTRGDDVYTAYRSSRPAESVTVRQGEETCRFVYEHLNDGTRLYVIYPSDPTRRVLLSETSTPEQVERAAVSIGQGPPPPWQTRLADQDDPYARDVLPDEYIANRIVRSAYENARRTNTVGWCYAGVKDALRPFGINLTGGSAYMARAQLLRDPRFAVVPMSSLRPGDILVHGANANHEHGHIAVYLGNGQEASDHVQRLITGQGYGGTTVFRYVRRGGANV